MLFKAVASYEKMQENGIQKKVRENYLVDAMSCTEAEARTINFLQPMVSGELNIKECKEVEYAEVVLAEEEDYFFEAKLEFITYDEKTNAEKKQKFKALIQEKDFDGAKSRMDELIKGYLADVHVCSLTETNIVDVIKN